MKVKEIRSLLIKLFLGALVVAALVAVISILVGSFNETAQRSIGTIFVAMVHILVLFGVLSITSKDPRTEKSTNLVLNSSIVIVVASFLTSVLAVWDLLDTEISVKLYVTYVVLLVAIFHAKAIDDIRVVYDKVAGYVYANFAFITLVVILLLGAVYLNTLNLLDGFYGRLLAAAAVIDFTLSMIVAVMQRLYLQKHPEPVVIKDQVQRSAAGRLVVAVILFFVFGWFVLTIISAFTR